MKDPMLTCLICPNSFDDLKEFRPVYVQDMRREFYDETAQRAHSAEQNRWQQLEVCIGPCGEVTVLIGHICPSCASRESVERLKLTRADEVVNKLDGRQASLLAWMTSAPSRPAAAHTARVTAANVDVVSERPGQPPA